MTKRKYFAKIPYFPPPVNGNFPISSLFYGEKNGQIIDSLIRSLRVEVVQSWVRMDKNCTKTGKNRSNYAKTGRFLGIYFSSAAEFLPSFFGEVNFSTGGGGGVGRFWPIKKHWLENGFRPPCRNPCQNHRPVNYGRSLRARG